MTGNPLKIAQKFFGGVHAIFWFCGFFWAPEIERTTASQPLQSLAIFWIETTSPGISVARTYLVVPCSGRRLLARIGAEIGTYDRGGAIGPPNRSENDDWGGG